MYNRPDANLAIRVVNHFLLITHIQVVHCFTGIVYFCV